MEGRQVPLYLIPRRARMDEPALPIEHHGDIDARRRPDPAKPERLSGSHGRTVRVVTDTAVGRLSQNRISLAYFFVVSSALSRPNRLTTSCQAAGM